MSNERWSGVSLPRCAINGEESPLLVALFLLRYKIIFDGGCRNETSDFFSNGANRC